MKLTENTLRIMTAVGILTGGIMWLSRIHFVADSAANMALENRNEQSATTRELIEMKADIKWIKRYLEGRDD